MRRDIAQGLDIRALMGSNADDLFRYRGQIKKRLLAILDNVKKFGASQVKDELERQ